MEDKCRPHFRINYVSGNTHNQYSLRTPVRALRPLTVQSEIKMNFLTMNELEQLPFDQVKFRGEIMSMINSYDFHR